MAVFLHILVCKKEITDRQLPPGEEKEMDMMCDLEDGIVTYADFAAFQKEINFKA